MLPEEVIERYKTQHRIKAIRVWTKYIENDFQEIGFDYRFQNSKLSYADGICKMFALIEKAKFQQILDNGADRVFAHIAMSFILLRERGKKRNPEYCKKAKIMFKILEDREKLISALESFQELNQVERNWLNYAISKIKRGTDCLSLSQEMNGKISYAKNDPYNNLTRIRTTLARYFRRQLKIDTDQISDDCLAKIQAHVFGKTAEYTINIVKGEEIVKAYKNQFGGHSCMTCEHSEFTQIYADNPNVSMIKYYDNIENSTARALLWKSDQGNTILDRIYPSNSGKHCSAIRQWAEENGFIDGYNTSITDTVTIKHNDVFPYLDTFRYTDDDPLEYSEITLNSKRGEFVFESQSGGYTGDNSRRCENCNCSIDEDDCNCVGDYCYCPDCFYEEYFHCECCGEVWDNDERIDFDGSCYCPDCAEHKGIHKCYHCGEYEKDCIECDDKYYCESCCENLNICYCDQCGNWEKDCISTENNTYCQDCADELNIKECEECGEITECEFYEKSGKWLCSDCSENENESETSKELQESCKSV